MLRRRASTTGRRAAGPRLTAATLTVVLWLALMPATSASTRSDLNTASSRLTALAERIKAEEAQASAAQGRLSDLNSQITEASMREGSIAADLVAAQSRIASLGQQVADLRGQVEEMAQTLFMQGAGSMQGAFLEPLLSSTSMADFSDRLADAQALGQSDIDVATKLSAAKAGLTEQADRLGQLQAQQSQVLSELTQARNEEAQTLSLQQQSLVTLDQTKDQIVSLIEKLHRRLQAEELSAVGTAFQGPGHLSYGGWAAEFLRTIGVSGCHSNMVVVVTWQYSEFTQAMWNPLADSLVMPGSTSFNSSHVQNYPSLDVGLQAVKTTLAGGQSLGYGSIVSSLARCSDPMTTAQAIKASAWCRGCTGGAYVTGNIAKVEANYSVFAKL